MSGRIWPKSTKLFLTKFHQISSTSSAPVSVCKDRYFRSLQLPQNDTQPCQESNKISSSAFERRVRSCPTLSAFLCSRSTCPCAGGGYWALRPRWCRTSAWPPVWSALGPCHAGTSPSGRSSAAGWWSPRCRCPHQRCWTFSSAAPSVSPLTHLGLSRAPAFLKLHLIDTIIVMTDNCWYTRMLGKMAKQREQAGLPASHSLPRFPENVCPVMLGKT